MHIQRARPESGAEALNDLAPHVLRKAYSGSLAMSSGLAGTAPRATVKRESITPSLVRPQSGTEASFRVTVPPLASAPGNAPVGSAASPLISYDPTGPDNELDDSSSKVSLTFPIFANPNNGLYAQPVGNGPPALPTKSAELEELDNTRENESNYHHTWNEDKLELKFMSETAPEKEDTVNDQPSALPSKIWSRRPIPILKPALWQIILFQM